MSAKLDLIEAELLMRRDDDELSVSSGDEGQVFTHNLMGFWTQSPQGKCYVFYKGHKFFIKIY